MQRKGHELKIYRICLEGCYQSYKGMCDKEVPQAQLDALVQLTKYLQSKYKIPISKIKKHHEYARYKLCPGDYFPWDQYINHVEGVTGDKLEQLQHDYIQLAKENQKLKADIKGFQEDIQYLNDQWKATSKQVFERDTQIKKLNNRIDQMKAKAKEIGEV